MKFVTSKCSQVQRSKGGMMDDDVVFRGPKTGGEEDQRKRFHDIVVGSSLILKNKFFVGFFV